MINEKALEQIGRKTENTRKSFNNTWYMKSVHFHVVGGRCDIKEKEKALKNTYQGRWSHKGKRRIWI